jgi:hypothetical protein
LDEAEHLPNNAGGLGGVLSVAEGFILSVENQDFRCFDWLIAKFSCVQRLF